MPRSCPRGSLAGEVAMLANVGGDPTCFPDLADPVRWWWQGDRAAARRQNPLLPVERSRLAVLQPLQIGLEERDTEVERIAEKDAREARRNDRAEAVELERERRIFARRAAAEIAACDDDIAGLNG